MLYIIYYQMSKLETSEATGVETWKVSKSNILKQTMKSIVDTFKSNKKEIKELDNQEVANGNNPFWIKKLNLEWHSFHQSDLIKVFDGIDKKKIENYKKICWNFENFELNNLKSKWVLLSRLLNFDESRGAQPIIIETENDGTYSLEHKTQRQWANNTRIKLFEVRQTKDNKNDKVEWNAQVKIVYSKDKVCLEIAIFAGNSIIVPIKSISQESNNIGKKPENKIVSDIEERLSQSKNKKVCDRTKVYLDICKWNTSEQMTEMYLMEKQMDILNLAEWIGDNWLSDRYPGREKKDFQELYKILYWE